MKRHELEHILRAASGIINEDDIIVIGSQSLLGQYPDAPDELLQSIEADIFPKEHQDLSLQIDGAIGERSFFHETFGYYAHGVDETTAILPADWRERLVKLHTANTGGAVGWCLEVHDLACSKLAAGRKKDIDFVKALIRLKFVDVEKLRSLISTMPRENQALVSRNLQICL